MGVTRRRALQVGGGVIAGAAVGVAGASAAQAGDSAPGPLAPDLPFDGPAEQQGIVTPRQRHLALAAFTLAGELRGDFGRGELATLMQDWSAAARVLCTGRPLDTGASPATELGAPADTGEAAGLGARGLTITFGFGGSVFRAERDLVPAALRPQELATPLPAFEGEALDAAWGGGDLLVAAGAESPAWMHGGGTYLVVRRIRMLLESWDRATLEKQQDTVGRTKAAGAALGQQREDDPVDLTRLRTAGEYAVPERSHVAVAHRAAGQGARIHRRPYSYADGVDPATGQLDAGLIFLAFQRSVAQQYVPLQQALARMDALNEYTQTIGSAVFALPPASRDAHDWVGRALFH